MAKKKEIRKALLTKHLDALIYASWKSRIGLRSLKLKMALVEAEKDLRELRDGKTEWDFPIRKTKLKHDKPDIVKPGVNSEEK